MNYDIPALKQQMLLFLNGKDDYYPQSLEQFPHVLAKIVELWGKPELDTYLQGLMLPDRVGRKGFPPDAAAEIFRLSFLHGSLGVTQEQETVGWGSAGNTEINRYFEGRSGRD